MKKKTPTTEISKIIESIIAIIKNDIDRLKQLTEISPQEAGQLTDYLKALTTAQRDLKKEEKDISLDISKLTDEEIEEQLRDIDE